MNIFPNLINKLKLNSSIQKLNLIDLFEKDPKRFQQFSIELPGLLFDYSKNLINFDLKNSLIQLVEKTDFHSTTQRMFKGEKINFTEKRGVLHIALRNQKKEPIYYEGKDVMVDVRQTLARLKDCSEEIRNQKRLGVTGKPIKNIVNIGIGGSDLGVEMVYRALQAYSHEQLHFYFVSNVDPSHLSQVLQNLNAEETLFIIASKTFTTQETLANANAARKWLSEKLSSQELKQHFIALSTNLEATNHFGIEDKNVFPFWEWVGGRFSVCSSIGLAVIIAIGYSQFEELLQGFHQADQHFQNTDLEKNIPVIMAILNICYTHLFGWQTQAIIPYSQYLSRLPAYLQQAEMESNGKSVDYEGNFIGYPTSPILWGEPGTNGQHAFFQLLHQGTIKVPCDFIGFCQSLNPIDDMHEKLMSNFFAQQETLAFGKKTEQLRKAGISEELISHRTFQGNRPSTCFLFEKLTPFHLGQLIGFYEHKIFTIGTILGINSFDQWGVELGKQNASRILKEFENADFSNHDLSTQGQISFYLQKK